MERAYRQAQKSFDEGGLSIGAVLARGGDLVTEGHNRRVQEGDPISRGEMDCLRRAGRKATYRDTNLYTTLSPCMMCAGTIVQFGIPRVVIGENCNFGGDEDFLRKNGVEVTILDHAGCIALMARLIVKKPALWQEDKASRSQTVPSSDTARCLRPQSSQTKASAWTGMHGLTLSAESTAPSSPASFERSDQPSARRRLRSASFWR
jgi:creatinine deaminase